MRRKEIVRRKGGRFMHLSDLPAVDQDAINMKIGVKKIFGAKKSEIIEITQPSQRELYTLFKDL